MGGLTKLEMVGKLNGQLRDMHMFALRIEVVSISELQRNGKQDPCNFVLNLKAFLLGKMLLKWMKSSHCTMVKAYHIAFSSILGAYALMWCLSEH